MSASDDKVKRSCCCCCFAPFLSLENTFRTRLGAFGDGSMTANWVGLADNDGTDEGEWGGARGLFFIALGRGGFTAIGVNDDMADVD
jgi:hypothetical protein